MRRDSMNRRDFSKLSVAALGGMAAGSLIGCGGGGEGEGDGGGTNAGSGTTGTSTEGAKGGPECWMSGEKNICRGLNVCAEHGQGDHKCAGTGSCFTNVAKHECRGMNECACEGGCGDNIGENACKTMGGCAVPLKEGMWEDARKKFEAAMKAADKTFGDAPAAPAAS